MFKDILQQTPYKNISVVGLAKNVGKTTTLNTLIQSAVQLNLKIGVCSIGVDGEKQDVWDYHDKPPVRVHKGLLAATASQCLQEAKVAYRIVEQVKPSSPMGPVYIIECLEDGELKLAGTHATEDIELVFSRFRALGVDRCFVDGAYDRLSTAKPDLTEAVILCVGASISPSFEQLCDEVSNVVTRFSLPIYDQDIELPSKDRICYLKHTLHVMEEGSILTHLNEVKQIITQPIEMLYIPGGLTSRTFEQLTHVTHPYMVVIQDGTRCFLPGSTINKWYRRGGKLYVLNPIHLLALSVNPSSPQGYHYHPRMMMDHMKRLGGDVPVIDCVRRERM